MTQMEKPEDINYPENTEGAHLARETRVQCNNLTAEQRKEFFEQAMRMIYGGHQTDTVPRH